METPEWENYKNAEFIQFYEHFFAIIEEHDLKNYGHEIKGWESKFQNLFETYNKSTKSVLSNELINLDQERGNICQLIRKNLEEFSSNFIEEKKDASEIILPMFRVYRKPIECLSFVDQTLVINKVYSLIENSEERTTALKTLGMKYHIEHLKTVNTSFEVLYIKHIRSVASTLFLKDELIELYNEFIEFVIARNTVTSYSIKEKISNLINQTNLTVMPRRSRLVEEKLEVFDLA